MRRGASSHIKKVPAGTKHQHSTPVLLRVQKAERAARQMGEVQDTRKEERKAYSCRCCTGSNSRKKEQMGTDKLSCVSTWREDHYGQLYRGREWATTSGSQLP
ncbi:uncharacterized protein LOC143836314 isoform X1 [Paroedura picta]|uniref:uncharacterized protein LOC143836314 isoform X1 n=1 Tax=Paroedura picta TaxID=143630 RepID=UPI004055CAAA